MKLGLRFWKKKSEKEKLRFSENEEEAEYEEEAKNKKEGYERRRGLGRERKLITKKKLRAKKIKMNYQEPNVMCHCGLSSRVMTAWSDTNLGRRF